MKRSIYLLFLPLFLLCIINVNAETLKQTEIENGKVELSISTDQGYMDTFMTTIEVKGNVQISEFIWNSALDNMALKDSKIKQDGKELELVVTAKAKNILENSKTISLGTITVIGEETTTYSFQMNSFAFTNLDKNIVNSNNLYVADQKNYTLTVKKEEPEEDQKQEESGNTGDNKEDSSKEDEPEPPKEETDTPEENTPESPKEEEPSQGDVNMGETKPTESENKGENSESSETHPSTNNDQNTENQDKTDTSNNNQSTDPETPNKDMDKNEQTQDKEENKNQNTEEKNETSPLIFVAAGVVAMVAIIGIIYLLVRVH